MLEVLGAACESVNAEPAVLAWLTRAVEACREGVAGLRDDRPAEGAPGVVAVLVFAGYESALPDDTQ